LKVSALSSIFELFTNTMQSAAKFPRLEDIFLLPILEVLGKPTPITPEL